MSPLSHRIFRLRWPGCGLGRVKACFSRLPSDKSTRCSPLPQGPAKAKLPPVANSTKPPPPGPSESLSRRCDGPKCRAIHLQPLQTGAWPVSSNDSLSKASIMPAWMYCTLSCLRCSSFRPEPVPLFNTATHWRRVENYGLAQLHGNKCSFTALSTHARPLLAEWPWLLRNTEQRIPQQISLRYFLVSSQSLAAVHAISVFGLISPKIEWWRGRNQASHLVIPLRRPFPGVP